MRRKMFVMPLAAAMVLSAVPAFASEGTSSAAEETVEETSEASSTEESESEGVGDVLANLEGTYEELFPVIADAKYDDLWLGFCAQCGDEENAQLYSDMLKGSTTALIMMQRQWILWQRIQTTRHLTVIFCMELHSLQ